MNAIHCAVPDVCGDGVAVPVSCTDKTERGGVHALVARSTICSFSTMEYNGALAVTGEGGTDGEVGLVSTSACWYILWQFRLSEIAAPSFFRIHDVTPLREAASTWCTGYNTLGDTLFTPAFLGV